MHDKDKSKVKDQIVELLKSNPIRQIACAKMGISRSTFYRWQKDDVPFAERVSEAMRDGLELVNDIAESQLLDAIKNKDLRAIFFWLKHRHKEYSSKIQLSGEVRTIDMPLTPEQQAVVQQALALAGLNSLNPT